MKHLRLLSISIVLCLCIMAAAQNKSGTVTDAKTHGGISYASVLVTFADSTTQACITDSTGLFTIGNEKNVTRIDASALGYVQASKKFAANGGESRLDISLLPSSVSLGEVVVKGERRLTTLTNEGLSYNMKADSRVKGENLLTALNKVPFVESAADGTLKVRGGGSFLIYLNGRPYEAAQQATKTVLSSVLAKDIDHVDVITNGSDKYGVAPGTTILNICTRQKSLDGFTLSTSLGATTQPTTDDELTLLFKKKNVDISLDYNYNLNGQRHQPATSLQSTPAQGEGNAPTQVSTDSKGDGNWMTHTIRAMLKWHVDSVNSLYADVHGLLTPVSQTGTTNEYVNGTYDQTYKLHNSTNSGSVESNVIWRNYFRSNPNRERLMIGYRYTYNPDKNHYYSTITRADGNITKNVQRTDGGMSEHSLTSSLKIMLAKKHSLSLSAKGILRFGRTDAERSGDNVDMNDERMRYDMTIGKFTAYYYGSGGKFYWGGGAALEQSHISMRLPLEPSLNYKRDNTNVLPYAYVYFIPNNTTQLILTYRESISRPTVDMLNPFRSKYNDFSGSEGNPQLKPSTTHSLSMQFVKILKNASFVVFPEYSHCGNAVLSYKYADNTAIISTYGNLGKTDDVMLNVNASWNPVRWMSLQLYSSIGHRWLKAQNQALSQNEWHGNLSPYLSLFLPHSWNIQANYGLYRNLSNPWEKSSTLNMYAFRLTKSFLGGRLTTSVVANSPFEKYTRMRVTTSLADGSFCQRDNYIKARSFGINVSYSLYKGKKVKIERDQTLKSSDQNTGVN